MEILIIGHSVKDVIHTGEKETTSPGGIYYSVLGVLSCKDERDILHLLTASDKDNDMLFSSAYSQVNERFLDISEKIPVVHLKIFEDAERCEYYENITNKLNLEKIPDLSRYDGILINMITGFDISAGDLLELRSHYKGLIYLDVHTLSRGLDADNQRNFRIIPDAAEWISSVDFLQVNENELFTLYPGDHEQDIVKKALLNGARYLILTKGELGARIFWLKDNEVNSLYYPASKAVSRNKVGCGDIFGSVFFCTYIKTLDISVSMKKAVVAAGCAAGYSGIKDFHNLRYDTLSRSN